METPQTDFWKNDFGKTYTDRNSFTNEEFEQLYVSSYGKTRTAINREMIGDLPRDMRILEVGCNIGLQLRCLQQMGFNNLYGIELQWYAVEKAKNILENVNVIQGSAFDIPFKDGYFDLVYTSGVLIHISPNDLPTAFQEMHRCSSKYIWGFEYYSDDTKDINYRNHEGFLWKADYAKLMMEQLPLKLVRDQVLPYISENEKGNVDKSYLLIKS